MTNRVRGKGELKGCAWIFRLALASFLAAACGKSPAAPVSATAAQLPPIQSAAPAQVFPEPAPTITRLPPTNMAAAASHTPPCSEEERSGYLISIDPLSHDMLASAKQAEKLEANNPEQVREGQAEAARLLQALQAVHAPACMAGAHVSLLAGFSGLAAAWDLIAARDYPGAKERLVKSYEQVVEAIVTLAGVPK